VDFICPVNDNRYHPICQRCPLPACKDDSAGREYYSQRNREIYRKWKKYQSRPLTERPKLLAIAFEYNIRTRQQVWEIIQRERSKVKR
jgi:hypothetical protein